MVDSAQASSTIDDVLFCAPHACALVCRTLGVCAATGDFVPESQWPSVTRGSSKE